MHLHPATKRELGHIAIGVGCFTALMLVVFLVIGRFTWPVFWGAILGGGYAILNFLFMALSAQRAVASKDMASEIMQRTYHLRMFGIAIVLVIGFALPCFSLLTVAIPLLFPRLTILVMQIYWRKHPPESASGKEESTNNGG